MTADAQLLSVRNFSPFCRCVLICAIAEPAPMNNVKTTTAVTISAIGLLVSMVYPPSD